MSPMSRLYLSLAIHNHQPVGNFDHVFAEAHRLAYKPLVAALERHPGVRLALHYTGPLRDWLLEHEPDLLRRVRALVARGQVEILTGGYYEPILSVLPDVDKQGQIHKLTQAVRDDFGYEATGLWLAERVWEPHLPRALAEAGIEYTIVDDTHFKYVGLTDDDLFGYYVTEEQGHTLKIFGTSKFLRYSIPWSPVHEVIDFLRGEASEGGHRVAVMGDDGEKFGLWPGTYEHCWVGESGKPGWMERFFAALEDNADWLVTIPPGEFARRYPALGRIYLPTASYDEMTEWALPARQSGAITRLKHDLQAEDRQDILSFVRGGFWRNFLVKYPEVNTLHKKMLWVSAKVAQMTGGGAARDMAAAQDRLWTGQCNCPYWHGVFGGVYLFHIRSANFGHLIAAENLADAARHGSESWVTVTTPDFDGDGNDEVLISSDRMNLYLAPDAGGHAFEWDWRNKEVNLANTLTRRWEGYHQELIDAAREERVRLPGDSASGEVETIHTTQVRAKEAGLENKLFRDWYSRASFVDHFLAPATVFDDFYRAEYGEEGDFVTGRYLFDAEVEGGVALVRLSRDGGVWHDGLFQRLRVEKTFSVRAGAQDVRVQYRLTNPSDVPLTLRFGVETNWGLLGGNGPGAYYAIAGAEPCSLAAPVQREDMRGLRMVVEWLDMTIALRWPEPAELWCFPLETVSNSEAGFERVYQGSCVMPVWPVTLGPDERWELEITVVLGEGVGIDIVTMNAE